MTTSTCSVYLDSWSKVNRGNHQHAFALPKRAYTDMTRDCLRVESDKELLLSCLWLRSSVVLGPYKLNQSKSNWTHTPVNSYGNPYSFKTARRRLERCCFFYIIFINTHQLRKARRQLGQTDGHNDRHLPVTLWQFTTRSFSLYEQFQFCAKYWNTNIHMILRFTVDLGS